MGIEPTESEVLFGPCNEDGELLIEIVDTREVNVGAVHDVNGAGLGNELMVVRNKCRQSGSSDAW